MSFTGWLWTEGALVAGRFAIVMVVLGLVVTVCALVAAARDRRRGRDAIVQRGELDGLRRAVDRQRDVQQACRHAARRNLA